MFDHTLSHYDCIMSSGGHYTIYYSESVDSEVMLVPLIQIGVHDTQCNKVNFLKPIFSNEILITVIPPSLKLCMYMYIHVIPSIHIGTELTLMVVLCTHSVV